MKRYPVAIMAAIVALGLIAADTRAITVREFLATAAGIPRNPTALLRSDTRRLIGEVKGSARILKAERDAAIAAGRRPAYCPPEGGASIGSNALLTRLNSIPAARRDISLTQAMREWMVERYPCA